ncbi:hypothetical protein BR93DRAFT_324031 [Coniochaeta sp. PMI_546]|nr:hypothetical protein BR93DRAFT_324031 [Coniochaeta sp. PMI_546]
MVEHDVHERHTAMSSTPVKHVPTCADTDMCAVSAAMPHKPEHIAHFPLDIPLPDHIYEHRPISAHGLMLHRIMADFMNPSRVTPRTYNAHISYPAEFDPIRAQDRQLGMDLKLMRKMLFTSHYQDPPPPGKPQLHHTTWEFSRNKRVLQSVDKPVAGPPNAPPTIGEEVIDLVQRYYFETDGAVARLWLERQHPPRIPTGPKASRDGQEKLRIDAVNTFTRLVKEQQCRERKNWRDEDTEHLRRLSQARARERALNLDSLYDGGAHLALIHRAFEGSADGERLSKPSLENYHFTMANQTTGLSHASGTFWQRGPPMGFVIQPRWCDRRYMGSYCSDPPCFGPDRETGRGRPKTRSTEEGHSAKSWSLKNHQKGDGSRRGRSEPPPGSFCAAKLPDPGGKLLPGKLMVMFPRLPLSVIDRRSRRRSLSRSHIANMFDWDCKDLEPAIERANPSRANKKQEKKQPQQLTRKYWAQERNAARTPAQRDSSNKHDTSSPPEFPLYPPCFNCTSRGHPLSECLQPCGYCGAPNPMAYESFFNALLPDSNSRGSWPGTGPPTDNAQEIFIAAPGGMTLIIRGNDTILLSHGGEIAWTRSWGTRNRVRLSQNVNRLTDDQSEDGSTSSEDDVDVHPVAVHGPGKHGNPHTADKCPVPREARCKCVAFPQFHVAARCRVRCSRHCGNGHPKGGFRHRNAMTCKARCCMCGIRGHAGRSCRLKKCRCGGQHLGQDCRIKVECSVKGCDRFLCGLHCRSCGGTERPFVGWECVTCRQGRGEDVKSETQGLKGETGRTVEIKEMGKEEQ